MMKGINNYFTKNTAEKGLFFILGIIIIIFIVWNKAIRERLPKTIIDFTNFYMLIFIFINVISLFIVIIVSVWFLCKTNVANKESKLEYFMHFAIINSMISLALFIKDIWFKSLKTVYNVIYDNCNISYILEKPFYNLSHFLKELPVKYSYILTLIYIVFNALPKIIPALLFVIELYCFNCLNYFYKSLFLYCIILVYNVLLWILEDISDKNTYFATAHINVIHYNSQEFDASFCTEVPKIENAIDIVSRKGDRALLEWFVYLYETYVDIKWLVYRLNKEKNHFRPYETIFISNLYLIGWLYVIYCII